MPKGLIQHASHASSSVTPTTASTVTSSTTGSTAGSIGLSSAAVGSVIVHAVVVAALYWIPVGDVGTGAAQPPQLQLREGEQVVEVQLRRIVLPAAAVESAAAESATSNAPPSASLAELPLEPVESAPSPFDVVELPEQRKVNTGRLLAHTPTNATLLPIPAAKVQAHSLTTSSVGAAAPRPSVSPSPAVDVTSPRKMAVDLPTLPPMVSLPNRDAGASASPARTNEFEATVETPARRTGVNHGVKIRSLPQPTYPSLSRRRGEEGTVVLRVFIRADGTAGDIRVVNDPGYSRLVDAAITAVRDGKFSPAMQAGEPVAMSLTIPFKFVLNG